MRTLVIAAATSFIGFAMSSTATHAAEVKVISANGMRDVIAETRGQFETATRHRLLITVIETGEIRKRVLAGQSYDVIIVPREAADEFEKAGKMVPGSAMALTRISFGLAVPADGPRPDISTPEALKRTLLATKTVLITDPATGGISGGNGSRIGGPLGPDLIALGAFAPCAGVLGDVDLWGVVLGAVIVGATVAGEAGLGAEVPGAGVGVGGGVGGGVGC